LQQFFGKVSGGIGEPTKKSKWTRIKLGGFLLEVSMSENIERAVCIPDGLRKIYSEMDISPMELLKNYALNQMLGRIHKYEAENKFFEDKYGCNLETFKGRLESMEEQENFTWDDDLMDWEFAAFNLKHWEAKTREILTG
jgi:hypothetical protein